MPGRARPAGTAIVRSEQAAVVGLDEHIDAAAIRRRDSHADLAPHAVWQPRACQLLPGVAAITRHMHAAAWPAAGHVPGCAARLPEAREDDVRIRRIERDIRRAGLCVLLVHLLPCLAAIDRAIDAAFRVWSEGMAKDGGKRDVGILWMHHHRADLSFLLPHMRPVLARID